MEQLQRLQKFLRTGGRRFKYVFLDWSCIPQDKPKGRRKANRTSGGEKGRGTDSSEVLSEEESLFYTCLKNMHLLYSGVHVLILHDEECTHAFGIGPTASPCY